MSRPTAVFPYTSEGVEIGAKDALAIAANARGFIGVASDGTNTRFVRSDTSGRLTIVGPAAEGSPVTGSPLLIGGSDGTNVRIPRVFDLDTGGGFEPILGVGLRLSSSGGSVEAKGQKTIAESIPVTMASNQPPVSITDTSATSPTYFAVFDRISPDANKYMAVLFNTSATKKLVVYRINRYNWQMTSVVGQTLEQYLTRISAYTGGTAVTVRSADSADSVPAGITAVHNPASVTEDYLVRRLFASSEEANLSNSNFYNAISLDYSVAIYERTIGTRGLVLRQNEGLAIRNVTSSTVGTVSYIYDFIVEDV